MTKPTRNVFALSSPTSVALQSLFFLTFGWFFVFSGPVASSENKWVTIANRSEATFIVFVHIVPAGNPDWGPDQLGANDGIAPGQSRTWNLSSWSGCNVDV